MSEQTINSFSKGMIKDVAETLRPEDSYEDAQDMKLNATGNSSEYIISNVNGNKLLFTTAKIPNILSLEYNPNNTLPAPWTDSFGLIMQSGTYYSTLEMSGNQVDEDDYFDDLYTALSTDPAFTSLNLNVAREGLKIKVWSETDDILNISFFGNYSVVTSTLRNEELNQQIIGWESINDDIYLLTTNDSSATGGYGAIFKLNYDKVTFDHTFKLIYANDLNFTTRNLIANPGGIEGLFETPTLQRIYWTDRLNPLRSINLVDPNIMVADVSTIDINTSIQLKKPILEDIINGGSLDVGHYQISYALKTNSGVTTSYSHTSNSIYIGATSISNNYEGYVGGDQDTVSNNAIRISISEIDTGFNEIDIIVLKKANGDSSTAEIFKVATIPVVSNNITYTYTGDEPRALLNELSFLAVQNLFNRCHAIAQKDNILFAANTKGNLDDLDFDARAYRFDSNGDIALNNFSGSPITVTQTEALTSFGLDEESDAINPDQTTYKYQVDGETLGGQGPNIKYQFTQEYLVTDTGSVGFDHPDGMPYGALANYNYPYRNSPSVTQPQEFDLLSDNKYKAQRGFRDFKSPFIAHVFKGYRREEVYRFAFVPIRDNRELYARWIADIKMPSVWEEWEKLIDERFDVPPEQRVPTYLNLLHTGQDNNKIFPITRARGGATHVCSLGVKFTVDIPADIRDQIDGFRIKRVKLEPFDRTIVAQGLVFHTYKESGGRDNGYFTYCLQGQSGTGGYNSYGAIASGKFTASDATTGLAPANQFYNENDAYAWQQIGNNAYAASVSIPLVSFHSPDFLFGTPANFQDGDELHIIAGAGVKASTTFNSSNLPADKTVFHKLYQFAPLDRYTNVVDIYEIEDALNVVKDSTVIIGDYEFNNRTPEVGPLNGYVSQGAQTTMLALDTGITRYRMSQPFAFSSDGFLDSYTRQTVIPGYDVNTGLDLEPAQSFSVAETIDRPDKLVANYVRKNLGQYGGPDYSARSQSVYINTGADILLKDDQNSYEIRVFGGDTYVNMFDTFKHLKNMNPESLGGENEMSDGTLVVSIKPDQGKKRVGIGFWFPVESYVNTDMRQGYSLNGEQSPAGFYPADNDVADAEQFPLDFGEDWKYNFVYSAQMDTQRSFPKPINQPDETVHPVRIWASNKKIYGETLDSWRYWDFDKYIDITGHFGEIRQLVTFKDQLNAWQENGFGVASVNERSITTDNSGAGVVLGKSGILPRFDYVSEIIGSWHQFSFAVSPLGIMFFDAKNGSLYVYGSQGLNDISEGKMNSWLYENTRGIILNYDAPEGSNPLLSPAGITFLHYAGISSTYDYINKEFLITFFDDNGDSYNESGDSYTLAYNDVYNVFSSFRSFKPFLYINDHKNIITPKPFSTPSAGYIHEKGEKGVFYDNDPSTSSVTITVNKEPYATKIFDNIRWFTEVFNPNGTEVSDETFSEAEIYNTYQTTGVRTVFKRLMREWKHAITYAQNSKNRIRSHYAKQKFKFLNNNNKEFRLHYIMNLFRRILK